MDKNVFIVKKGFILKMIINAINLKLKNVLIIIIQNKLFIKFIMILMNLYNYNFHLVYILVFIKMVVKVVKKDIL